MLKPAITVKRSVAGFSILLGIYLLYVAIRLVMLASTGSSLLARIDKLQVDNAAANPSALSASVESLSVDVENLNSIANDPLLEPIKWLPVVGKDFSAVAQLADASHGIATAAEPLLSSLTTLDASQNGDSWNAFKTDAAAGLGSRIDALLASVEKAETVVTPLTKQSLDFGLSQKIQPLGERLKEAKAGLTTLKPLATTLALVLAQPKPKTWFIATQNLAEARATGGILGSFAVVTVANGKVKLVAAGSDQDLAAFGKVNFSALPEEVRSLWGVNIEDWRDMNASLHTPYFGEQIANSFSKIKKIDGVLFMGQGTVAQLVAATGSMNIDGVEITSSNAADFLGKGIYARYESVPKKNAWVVAFMHTLFSRLSDQKYDAKAMWAAAIANQSGDRLSAWSVDPALQTKFVQAQVAGVVSDKLGSTTLFSVNNAGGNKLDAYLKLKASYALGACGQLTDYGFDGREATFALNLKNGAPKKGLPGYVTPRLDSLPGQHHTVGSNRELVSIYAPVGATFTEFTLDGDLINATEGVDRGHPVWVLDIELEPGETKKLVAKWVEPVTDTNGREVQTQPVLIAPVAFNSVDTEVKSSGFCEIRN